MINSTPHPSSDRSPLAFFLLVFALAVPFWVLGGAVHAQLMPGLPYSALMFVCPTVGALILVYRRSKFAGMAALLTRSFDFARIRAGVWYVPTVLLMPGVMIASFAVMRAMGTPVPAPQVSVLPTISLFAVFFITALGEELGWSGYALDPMQTRWGALQAGLLLGAVWAAWHIVPLVQAHRTVEWIAWWSLGTVSTRVIMVWLYNNTGRSVFAVTLFHTMINVTWQLFPDHGSYFDPRVTGTITAGVATIVTMVWGPCKLARFTRT